MNLNDLKKELLAIPVNLGIVSYNEGFKIDGYNIDCVHGVWRYYYVDEYQTYSDEHRFSSESDLCEALLQRAKLQYENLEKRKNRKNNNSNEKTECDKIIYL